MKHVGGKPDTRRTAQARAELRYPVACAAILRSGTSDKGDILATARVAGIMAAKRTDDIIPLCHPLPLQQAEVRFEIHDDRVEVFTEVETISPTGVEMEALTAASVAALTVYDMLKPYVEQTELCLAECRLLSKTGGKSHYRRRLSQPVPAAVIVLSDRVSAGQARDTAGASVQRTLEQAGFGPIDFRVLPDEADPLRQAVKDWLAGHRGLLLTVGGTGTSDRDISVETVEPMIERAIPGLMETARAYGQRRMPFAALSRGVAGMIGDSLIATLPGSRSGAEESLAPILPALIHVFEPGDPHDRHGAE
ncbi:MAG: bifunctional molybdenum cofactor biosynthesis protein MoaC/MoaB [Salinisphaeraceae bacterium]|jgi:molybdenum cofactor biosynthesis protein MoaC|nr:bifunctional molybdenum cofactor biosynthesis protein MoaC/MoaB [Salinisphaeraceae bacterium]